MADKHEGVDDERARACEAQLAGDHVAAERLFAAVAAAKPSDAEARFAQAVSAGWAGLAGAPRFDEMVDGIAAALERTERKHRPELRHRAARSLVILAEVTYDAAAQAFADEPARGEVRRHMVLGAAVVRLLDAAIELDPDAQSALRTLVRVCDELLDVAAGVRFFGIGAAPCAAKGEVAAVNEARTRALRHLAALDC